MDNWIPKAEKKIISFIENSTAEEFEAACEAAGYDFYKDINNQFDILSIDDINNEPE